MLVEKRVQDKISTISSLAPTTTAAKIAIYTADFPCTLRIRQLGWSGRSSVSSTVHQAIAIALVIVRSGESAHSIAAWPASGNGDDLYVPADRVVWQRLLLFMDSNAGTGPGGESGDWDGDGSLIALSTGDSIWWTTLNTDAANACVLYLSTLMDIVK